MNITHIWLCIDTPGAYQKFTINEADVARRPEVIEMAEKEIKTLLVGDHVHVFDEGRPSPTGNNVFHTCPGKIAVFGDNVVLGEE